MVDNSALNERLSFDNAIKMLVMANFKMKNGREMTKEEFIAARSEVNVDEVTQGYLWTEATLLPAQQVIQFPLVDTQQVPNSPNTPTMRLLTMQDSFLISTLSYFLINYSYTASSQANPNFTTGGYWAPITYSATWENGSSGVNYSPGCDMFWIGAYLSLEVNKKLLIPYWDCYKHYKAPIMQAVTSQYIPNPIQGFQNSHDGSVDGFYPVQPNIVIGGGRGNILKLNLAANIPATIAPFNGGAYNVTPNGIVSKAVVCTRGILMQNSTTLK